MSALVVASIASMLGYAMTFSPTNIGNVVLAITTLVCIGTSTGLIVEWIRASKNYEDTVGLRIATFTMICVSTVLTSSMISVLRGGGSIPRLSMLPAIVRSADSMNARNLGSKIMNFTPKPTNTNANSRVITNSVVANGAKHIELDKKIENGMRVIDDIDKVLAK
jgi:hypothetical protein